MKKDIQKHLVQSIYSLPISILRKAKAGLTHLYIHHMFSLNTVMGAISMTKMILEVSWYWHFIVATTVVSVHYYKCRINANFDTANYNTKGHYIHDNSSAMLKNDFWTVKVYFESLMVKKKCEWNFF